MTKSRSVALTAPPLLLAAYLLGGASAASVPPAARSVETFDRAVLEMAADCRTLPSNECVAIAWREADADGDGYLSEEELEALLVQIGAWAAWKGDDLPPPAASAIGGALHAASAIGVGRLLHAFDTDGDGLLSPAEAFSDIRLDERPIGKVLTDPGSLDRPALASRLAPVSPLLAALVRRAPLKQP